MHFTLYTLHFILYTFEHAGTGFAGIAFVLLRAAAGLEKKQAEKYGGGDGLYEDWVAGSWAGPTL